MYIHAFIAAFFKMDFNLNQSKFVLHGKHLIDYSNRCFFIKNYLYVVIRWFMPLTRWVPGGGGGSFTPYCVHTCGHVGLNVLIVSMEYKTWLINLRKTYMHCFKLLQFFFTVILKLFVFLNKLVLINTLQLCCSNFTFSTTVIEINSIGKKPKSSKV